jgi:hypothetical protein
MRGEGWGIDILERFDMLEVSTLVGRFDILERFDMLGVSSHSPPILFLKKRPTSIETSNSIIS